MALISPRLASLPPYPFERLSALLDPHPPGVFSADGPATLSLSIGEPRHPYPDFIADIIHAGRGRYGQYPTAAGSPELREAISAWLTWRFSLPEAQIDPERNVQALAGTREGLYMLAQIAIDRSLSDVEPVVLMPNPFYQCYLGAAVMAGARAVPLPATRESGFLPDLDSIGPEVLERTKLFFICSPANPQGVSADRGYLEQAIELARRHDFILAVDECYSEIYDTEAPVGALDVCASMGGQFENVVVFHSLSKRSSVPGLRVGFCAGDPDVVAAYRKLRDYGGSPIPLPLDAAAAALWKDEVHVGEARAAYRQKIDLAEAAFGGRFEFYRPSGGFFLWLKVHDGEETAIALWRERGVQVLPGAFLGVDDPDTGNPGRQYIRLALVHAPEVLEAAFAGIAETI